MVQVITDIELNLTETYFASKLRIEEASPEAEEFNHLYSQMLPVAKPKIAFFETAIAGRDQDSLVFGGARFQSRVLVEKTSDVETVYPFIISCGHELDELDFDRGDILLPFWHDFFKEEVFDQAAGHFRKLMAARLNGKKQAVLYPADEKIWPHRELRSLFNIFPSEILSQLGVTLNESNLISPNKSSCGIVFGVDYDFCSCDLCDRKNCSRTLRCGDNSSHH